MSGIDSTVAVASRSAYRIRSAGDQRRASGRRARSRRGRAPAGTPRVEARCETRGSTRACRACRRCARARGPPSSARAPRTRRTSGAEQSEILSPDAAGRVLVDLGAGQRRPARAAGPDAIIASVQVTSSRVGHAAPDDRHEQRGELVVGDLAVGGAADERRGSRRRRARRRRACARCRDGTASGGAGAESRGERPARKLSPRASGPAGRDRRRPSGRDRRTTRASRAPRRRTPGPKASSGTCSRVWSVPAVVGSLPWSAVMKTASAGPSAASSAGSQASSSRARGRTRARRGGGRRACRSRPG